MDYTSTNQEKDRSKFILNKITTLISNIFNLKINNFSNAHKKYYPTIAKYSWTYPRLWKLKLNDMTKSWPVMKYQIANI